MELATGEKPKALAMKLYYQFHITKWDETGNVLLERHTMTVQRQNLYNARTAVRKKYPPKQGYFEELNELYTQIIHTHGTH